MATPRYNSLQADADEDVPQTDTFKSEIRVDSGFDVSGRPLPVMRRVGVLPSALLLLSILGTVAFVTYVSFLWFCSSDNSTWRSIAYSNWLTRSIAIAALILRTAVTVQAGVASSMLAAILLESNAGIHLPSLASLSQMRASAVAPHSLLLSSWSGITRSSWLLFGGAGLLSITTILLQFTSTLLLGDVDTAFLPGETTPYAFTYTRLLGGRDGETNRNPKWNYRAFPWPIFAEYAEGSSFSSSSGIADTGITMRALLPISDQQTRTNLHHYEGPAPVFDSRVVCIRPEVTTLSMEFARDDSGHRSDFPTIRGNISVPPETKLREFSPDLMQGEPVEFACEVSHALDEGAFQFADSYWPLVVCSSEEGVFGVKTDVHPGSPPHWGYLFSNYLLMNTSDMSLFWQDDDPIIYGALDKLYTNHSFSDPGLSRTPHNEWTKVYGRPINNATNVTHPSISFSFCSAPYGFEKFNISASTSTPLKEPDYGFDSDNQAITFDRFRKQLLNPVVNSPEERGVMSLRKEPWMAYMRPLNNTLVPWMSHGLWADMSHIPNEDVQSHGILDLRRDWQVDLSIVGVVQEILRKGGNAAEALQSLLMGCLVATYQDLRFYHINSTNDESKANYTTFVDVQVPGGSGVAVVRPAGATTAYITVTITLLVHLAVVGVVVTLYIRRTQYSLLWQAWHATAQSINTFTEPYLIMASLATDSDVKRRMREEGVHEHLVTIGMDCNRPMTAVGLVRQRTKNAEVGERSRNDSLEEELPRSARDV